MAGFRATRKLIKIAFASDHELHGLEITCKAATLGEQRTFQEGYPKDAEGFAVGEYAVRYFLDHVIEWNLEDEDGAPLPVTYEAWETNMLAEWQKPIIDAFSRRPLGNEVSEETQKKSESGDSTETTPLTEASLPMEALS